MNESLYEPEVGRYADQADVMLQAGDVQTAVTLLGKAVDVAQQKNQCVQRPPAIQLAKLIALLRVCMATPGCSADVAARASTFALDLERMLHARMSP